MRRNLGHHAFPLGLALALTAASCGSHDPSEFRGTWTRRPPSGSGLSYLSLDPSTGGLHLEVETSQPSTTGNVSFHGHDVAPVGIGIRTGASTAMDPLEVAWASSDQLTLLFSGDSVQSASWSEIPSARRTYGESLRLRTGDDGRQELRLPPALAAELGLGAEERLIRLLEFPLFTQWTAPRDASGRWQSANWPPRLVRLADGGLPITEWPATRVEVDADGGFQLFALVEGQARSLEGSVSGTPEGRWLLETTAIPPRMVLDDGTSVGAELAVLPGPIQRALWLGTKDPGIEDGGFAFGLVITGTESGLLGKVTPP